MQEFFVYIVRCNDGTLYVGHTDDMERRWLQHLTNALPCYTSRRHPLTLALIACFGERMDALERERQLKGWTRAKKEALIARNAQRLHELARSRDESAPLGERLVDSSAFDFAQAARK